MPFALSLSRLLLRSLLLATGLGLGAGLQAAAGEEHLKVLRAGEFAPLVERFNTMENENRANLVPNAEAWDWLRTRIPLFECSDKTVTELWYYRWWALRKHLRKDPSGHLVYTEFLTKPRPVSSALGHHLMEGRWLRDQSSYDSYVDYWLHGEKGGPQPHLHKYSSWLSWALWQRSLVTGDKAGMIRLLDDLAADYRAWDAKHLRPDGMYWQNDVWDAMEESISGSRRERHVRPTINSYMFGNATALAEIARQAGRPELVKEFSEKASTLRRLVQEQLWDPEARFFKVRTEQGRLADVREQLGFLPWYFGLPEPGKGFEEAWRQFSDPQGFRAPMGLTTAERRHPLFRSHGVGTCEWDGAVWPFASSQTLTALGRVLREYPQQAVTRADYHDAFMSYVRSHRYDGLPYIGEYQDEVNGAWLKGRDERSRYYNHSTFADLLVTGLVGLQPHDDDTIDVSPLLTDSSWDWFCLDGVRYRGHDLTVLWDRDGTRYGRGKGLRLLLDGREIAQRDTLGDLSTSLAALEPLPETCYLFAYFLVNGVDGLHLAWSRDGYRFEKLGGGRSYLVPTVGEARIMRDPSLLRGPDGVFHLVWTSGWEGKSIAYAASPDLLGWGPQKEIPVMAHEPAAQNCWAPELAWDPASGEYHIHWATTILGRFPETALSNRRPERNHRIYSVTTKDFNSFSPTRLFYDGGYNVIDAMMVPDGARWLMFVKNETLSPKREKNVRMIVADTITGPFSEPSPAITGADYWAEGPTALKVGGEWRVYFDKHMENRFGLVSSTDLREWKDQSDRVDFPRDARHGTVLAVPRGVLLKLLGRRE